MKLLIFPPVCAALGAGQQPGSVVPALGGTEDAMVWERRRQGTCSCSWEQACELQQVKTSPVLVTLEFFTLQFVASYAAARWAVAGGRGYELGGWRGSGSTCLLCHLAEKSWVACVTSVLHAGVTWTCGLSVTVSGTPKAVFRGGWMELRAAPGYSSSSWERGRKQRPAVTKHRGLCLSAAGEERRQAALHQLAAC